MNRLNTVLLLIILAGMFFIGAGQKGVNTHVVTVHHTGIPSERVDCLEWVSKNFDKPVVHQFALMCGHPGN